MKFSFNWETLVDHFNINDQVNINTYINPKTGVPYFKLKNPGPWNAIKQAAEADRIVLEEGVANCPKPTNYMTKKVVDFNPRYDKALGMFIRH